MNTVKKITALVLMVCMVLGICACGQEAPSESTTQPETTESTTLPTPAATEPEEETVDTNKVTYTVYVVDEDNNPVTGGMVQFCLESCSPVVIDESGVATFTAEPADYEVKMLSMPAGYTYSTEQEVFNFAEGESELTIVLKPEA